MCVVPTLRITFLRTLRCTFTEYFVGPRCNRGEGGGAGLSTCLCIHAEENALLEAGRERIRESTILYCDTYVFMSLIYLILEITYHLN